MEPGEKKRTNSVIEMQKIGKYVVLRELGRGAFGTVYLARDCETGNNFALKCIDIATVERVAKVRQLFFSEVSIMNKINHPNILHLHAFMRDPNNYLLVVDYCNGGDLQKKLEATPGGTFDEAQAVDYLRQIIDGFRELQRYKVLHRDFKLANIFLHNGRVVIGDFGFAKEGIDTTTTVLGTPLIRAPEIADEADAPKYSSKVDVWSTGIVFYEMLFGKNPFYGETRDIIHKHILEREGDQLPFPKPISENAKDFLRKTLQADPAKRLDWNDCFKHPLITGEDKSATDNLLLPLPPEELFIPLISALQVEHNPAPAVEPLSDNEKMIAREIFQRLKHEENIVVYVISAFTEANRLSDLPQFAALSEPLTFLALLLLKKSVIISNNFTCNLAAGKPVADVKAKYFELFLRSEHFGEILASFRDKADKLGPAFAKFVQDKLPYTSSPKYEFIYDPSFCDARAIDDTLKSEIRELCIKRKDPSLAPADVDLLSDLLARSATCTQVDQNFRYNDPASKARFDWPAFFQKLQARSKSETQEFLDTFAK